jgi:3-dehydroquinate synthase
MYNILNIKSKILDYKLGFVDSLTQIESIIDQSNTITVIDSNVNKLYPSINRESNIIIECNEEVKTLVGAGYLLNELKNRKANIKTKLIVIGGGIIQDLVGFCASIYCRGIKYTLIPTTLLAQTDSCVGGKTSINLDSRKNILGTFYPPTDIIIYTSFLKTLSELDYLSGMGEIYKFHILQNKIREFDFANCSEKMILDGLTYKIDILSRDEFDKGERKFLNFGHTFGHALESTSNNVIPHGIAVIIGCMIAITVSKQLGYNVDDYELSIEKGYQMLKNSNLVFEKEWFDINKLLEIIKSDKKSTGKLTMVLINDKPILADVENIVILENILKQTYESIRLRNTVS